MTSYIIGDVQGCFQSLQALLKKIQFSPAEDQLIFLGDLVNRGPDSLTTLRFIAELPHKQIVLGNHDLHLIALAHGAQTTLNHRLTDILTAADGDALIQWLIQQPLCLQLDNYFIAHAGFYPLWTPTLALKLARDTEKLLIQHPQQFIQQMYGNEPSIWHDELTGFDRARFVVNAFTRMRFINQTGELNLTDKGGVGDQPNGFFPWYEYPALAWEQHTIIFGHWAALMGKTDHANRIALDTGCVWGQRLTAMRLEDHAIFSVAAME